MKFQKLITILLLSFVMNGITDVMALNNEGQRAKAYDFTRELGRGANFMAAKMEGRFHSNHDFKLLKQSHFTHCRIGGKLNLHVGEAPDYVVDQSRINDLKEAADMCLENGLIAVIDPLHLYNELYTDDQLPVLKKIWSQVASAFANYPLDQLAFEIMNEPHNKYNLEAIIKESLGEIRKVDGNQERIVIVSGQGFSTRQALINAFKDDVIPNDDPYLIGTFHYYDPRNFTKQGSLGVGVNWGENNDSDWSIVGTAFDEVQEANHSWAQRNQTDPLPIYLGEYGVDNQAPEADRKRWLSWIRMQAEKRGFATALWNMYNLNSKGIGPWEKEQKQDPSTRYFEEDVVEVLMTRYEMEQAESEAQIIDDIEDSSGGKYLNFSNLLAGNKTQLQSIYIPKSDKYVITIRYKNETEADAILEVASFNKDGSIVADDIDIRFPATLDSDKWGKITFELDFEAGENNLIQLECKENFESLQLDYLCISMGEYHDRLYPADLKIADIPTAVLLPTQNKNIIVYPTPFSNYAVVSLEFERNEKILYHVNDVMGRRIEKGTIDGMDSKFFIGHNYREGYYLLNLIGKNWRKSVKLIKKNEI